MQAPSHLFISYASENRTFAEWLARKLASAGYAVWLDTLKMLGGEPWPQTIDAALNRSGRLLALMSANSIEKDLPVRERTKGLSIGRERKIPDFVIPLRLDEAEWDWTLHNHTGIPFHEGWAAGWRQLLKKLDQIQFPRTLSDGAVLAQQSMEPENLVLQEPEALRLNAIRADITQPVLKVFALPRLTDEAKKQLQTKWPCYLVADKSSGDKAVSFIRPPSEVSKGIRLISDVHRWSEGGAIMGVSVRSILPALVRAAVWARLHRLGCNPHPNPRKREIFYLPETFNETGKLPFTDLEGKRHTHKIRRYNTISRATEKEKVFFHFAFRCDLAKGLDAGFYIQLVPTIMLFDTAGSPIVDDRVNRLRRKITRGYYNAEWRDRYLAAEQLLLSTQATATDGITLAPAGISLGAPCRLNEALFEKEAPPPAEAIDSEDAGELPDDEPLTAADHDEE
ncbi:MAG: toll/interleukin-1 receptor domain-containing protein [Prosthecobacter sp.]